MFSELGWQLAQNGLIVLLPFDIIPLPTITPLPLFLFSALATPLLQTFPKKDPRIVQIETIYCRHKSLVENIFQIDKKNEGSAFEAANCDDP